MNDHTKCAFCPARASTEILITVMEDYIGASFDEEPPHQIVPVCIECRDNAETGDYYNE